MVLYVNDATQCLHLCVGELEVEDGGVLHDPGRGHGLRDHDYAPLNLPSKHTYQ